MVLWHAYYFEPRRLEGFRSSFRTDLSDLLAFYLSLSFSLKQHRGLSLKFCYLSKDSFSSKGTQFSLINFINQEKRKDVDTCPDSLYLSLSLILLRANSSFPKIIYSPLNGLHVLLTPLCEEGI
jgi:hypothetical protein